MVKEEKNMNERSSKILYSETYSLSRAWDPFADSRSHRNLLISDGPM